MIPGSASAIGFGSANGSEKGELKTHQFNFLFKQQKEILWTIIHTSDWFWLRICFCICQWFWFTGNKLEKKLFSHKFLLLIQQIEKKNILTEKTKIVMNKNKKNFIFTAFRIFFNEWECEIVAMRFWQSFYILEIHMHMDLLFILKSRIAFCYWKCSIFLSVIPTYSQYSNVDCPKKTHQFIYCFPLNKSNSKLEHVLVNCSCIHLHLPYLFTKISIEKLICSVWPYVVPRLN